MKIKFLALVALCVLLTARIPVRAEQNPLLFGSQTGAYNPVISWTDTLLAVCDEESQGFQMWDVASRKTLWKTDDYFLGFSPDDSAVMVAHSADPIEGELHDLAGVRLDWLDAHDGHVLGHMDAPNQKDEDGESETLLDYSFSPDGRCFLWATPTHLYRYELHENILRSDSWLKGQAAKKLTTASFVPFKEQLLAYDGEVALWNTLTGAQIRSLRPAPAFKSLDDDGTFLDVSPDGFSFVLNTEGDEASRAFRLSDGKPLWQSPDWPTFSRDGKLAYISTDQDTGLDVVNAQTGRKLGTFSGPNNESFDFSSDGKWLYEAHGGKIYRWKIPIFSPAPDKK